MYSSDTVHRAVNILIKTLNILSRTNIYKHKFIKYKLETCDLFCGSRLFCNNGSLGLAVVTDIPGCVRMCMCVFVCLCEYLYIYIYIYIYIYMCTRLTYS
jgi:hypothetical protein